MEDYQRLTRAYRQAQIKREQFGQLPLTQASLAKELGITQTAVSKLMTGAMPIPTTRCLDLAECLQCSVSDISPGVAAQLEAAAQGLTVASKIAYKKAGIIGGNKLADILKQILAGELPDISEYEHCTTEHSGSTYCIKVEGEAMSPMIPAGSWAFVDTKAQAEVNKPVCLLRGKRVVFALWKGDDYCEYGNPNYPDRVFSLGKKDAVVGRVIETKISW